MDINNLKKVRQKLITESNPEWAFALNLRNLVRHEFATQGWLTSPTLDAILDWKLRKQRNRTEKHRNGNTAELIMELTGAFWRIRHENPDKELDVKLAVLMAIPGTGIGIASAIQTLATPENFGIIDFRNWKVLYNEDKRQFTTTEYKRYLEDVRKLASQLDCDVQEVDYILWKKFETRDDQKDG